MKTPKRSESKIFDLSAVDGYKLAERYKARMESKYDSVRVTPLGVTRIRIEASKPTFAEVKA